MFDTGGLPAPIWVDTPGATARLKDELAKQRSIAVDTESNSLHAYRERVCLIQFSTRQTDYIVDPLAEPETVHLGTILAAPSIEKVFHAAEYDLICLRRDYDFQVRNLFDTMHAARILGYAAVGLEALLAEKFGVKLEKKYQKADWGARPLPASHLHYARLDTHFLLDLRDGLETELRQKDRLELAQEDFRRMEDVEIPEPRTNADVLRRLAIHHGLLDREAAILKALLTWRESAAERLDRPVYKILSEATLVELARAAPATIDDLEQCRVSARQMERWGGDILEAVRLGVDAPAVQPAAAPKRDEATIARVEKLKRWRKRAAEEAGVESDIVLPRAYLLELAARPPQSDAELAERLRATPTRVARYGGEILQTLIGHK